MQAAVRGVDELAVAAAGPAVLRARKPYDAHVLGVAGAETPPGRAAVDGAQQRAVAFGDPRLPRTERLHVAEPKVRGEEVAGPVNASVCGVQHGVPRGRPADPGGGEADVRETFAPLEAYAAPAPAGIDRAVDDGRAACRGRVSDRPAVFAADERDGPEGDVGTQLGSEGHPAVGGTVDGAAADQPAVGGIDEVTVGVVAAPGQRVLPLPAAVAVREAVRGPGHEEDDGTERDQPAAPPEQMASHVPPVIVRR